MSLADLCASAWALSAVRVAIESDLLLVLAAEERDARALATAIHIDPAVTRRLLEVLEANDFVVGKGTDDHRRTFSLTAEGADLVARIDWVRADVAVTLGYTQSFVVESRRSNLGGGWQHADGEVIRAQSMLSELLNGRLVNTMLSALPEFERLTRANATLLDVGAGGGGISIAFCRHFPSLRAVALEPLRAARLEAKTKIDASGLSKRIEIRDGRLEEISEEGAYDVIFIATPFMNDAALATGLVHAKEALASGGVILSAAYRAPPDHRCAAASRLRLALWGGGARSRDDLARLMEAAGLDVTGVDAPGALLPVVGRVPRNGSAKGA